MKSWTPRIKEHIDHWSNALGPLSWWPKFIYHFTDIKNAISILESGILYSRSEAIRLNLMQVDNASQDVINQTCPEYQRFVRFYFRPKTPTLFRNEGIRPVNQRELNSHCGIPVYFCLDSMDVLSRDETEFSNGNMGKNGVLHGNSLEFFQNIPFNLVFHEGPFKQEEKETIINHRHAEVLLPNQISIESPLKHIYCRTIAERNSLINLLPNPINIKWANKIKIADFPGFYNKKWTFVEEVVTVEDRVIFRFNPDTKTPGPFVVNFCYLDSYDHKKRVWTDTVEKLSNSFTFRITDAISGSITLHLDNTLAYSGNVIFQDLPF
jgi:hypothetical protein